MPVDGVSLVDRYALPPAEIEATSLRYVAAALDDLREWTEDARPIVQRMVYASGDLALAPYVRVHPRAVADGVTALRAGCPMLVDVHMVAAAVDRARLTALGGSLHCAMDLAQSATSAISVGRRSAAQDLEGFEGDRRDLPLAVRGMRAAAALAHGAVVIVGTAPTALLALLDMVDDGEITPALIIGTPVGFTAAAESKAELMERSGPYITVEGTRGGAALAAAAANALLRLAADTTLHTGTTGG
jgi:precorrin-8X/cobalt-precorrin-8 methylmutase